MIYRSLLGIGLTALMISACDKNVSHTLRSDRDYADPAEIEIDEGDGRELWSRFVFLREQNKQRYDNEGLFGVLLRLDRDNDGKVNYTDIDGAYKCELEAYTKNNPDCCLDKKGNCEEKETEAKQSKQRCFGFSF